MLIVIKQALLLWRKGRGRDGQTHDSSSHHCVGKSESGNAGWGTSWHSGFTRALSWHHWIAPQLLNPGSPLWALHTPPHTHTQYGNWQLLGHWVLWHWALWLLGRSNGESFVYTISDKTVKIQYSNGLVPLMYSASLSKVCVLCTCSPFRLYFLLTHPSHFILFY